VTVKAPPKRVVALDFPSADAALALGATLVGMYEVSYVKGGIQEWTKAELGAQKPELLNTDMGFPLEKIAALRPDLILGTNTYPLVEDAYDKLSAIAPTITHVDAPGVDSWQTGTLQVGKALGKEDEAKQLIADAEAKVAAAKADHPEFAGKSLAFFNYVAGDGLYAVSADSDFSIKFLTELGFSGVAPAIAKLKGTDGRALVSPERYRLLDAGIVIGTSPDPKALEQLHGDPLFKRVPAVGDGHWVGLGIGPATAMAFPSVLSVPYAVDALVPKLSAALR
jgi:iron complex transport system substrate-binding protein